MRGMNPQTGDTLEGIEYLQHRLRDVLTTPLGSRIMRREYGCGLFERLDENINAAWLVQCYQDIAEAVSNPINGLQDFQLKKITPVMGDASDNENGMTFQLTGNYVPLNNRLNVDVPINGLQNMSTEFY